MKIIHSSVQRVDNEWAIRGSGRGIERAGRTCYKSVGTRYFRLLEGPKNSLESNLIKQAQSDVRVAWKRGADFDPAYYLSIPNKFIGDYLNIEQFDEETFEDSPYYENLTAEDFVGMLMKSGHGAMLEHGTVYLDCPETIFWKYNSNKFSKVIAVDTGETIGKGIYTSPIYKYYVTTNLRVLVENDWLDDLKYVCEPTEYHAKRVMVRFICDRGVSHEIVRHKMFCVA